MSVQESTYPPAPGTPTGAALLAKPQPAAQAAPGAPQPAGLPLHQPLAPQRPPAPASVCTWGRLPQELRQRRQWLLAGPNDKGERKVPLSLDAQWRPVAGSSTDAGTWLDFDTAVAAATHYGHGIGYVLHDADPFTCVDFDVKSQHNAPDRPDLWTSAAHLAVMQGMVADLDSYTEWSQSAQGVHVWTLGKFKGDGIKRKGVEVYCRARFMACTGRSVHDPALPIAERGEAVGALVAAMRGAEAAMDAHMALTDEQEVADDEAVLALAGSYSNAAKFEALRAGQWATWEEPGMNGVPHKPFPSQSEADMAYMALLAGLTKSNEQCRRLFLASLLGQREKAQGRHGGAYLNRMLRKLRGRHAAEDARRQALIDRNKVIGEGEMEPLTGLVMGVQQMCTDLVYIRNGSGVAWRDMPRRHYSGADAPGVFAGCFEQRLDPATGKLKNEHCFPKWKSAGTKRVDVETLTFDPRYGTFCADPSGSEALNQWRPIPHTTPDGWAALAQPFLDHVVYLVPDSAERVRFLDWLAHIEQRPGELPHYGYLMIALRQGVGRNWLASVVARMWRGHVAVNFDLNRALAKGFNHHLSRKLLAVVDEINAGGTGEQWAHSEKLKQMVTEEERLIDKKYGMQWLERNCCRWLVFSNHLSAIPLNDTDRRWQVVLNPAQPQGPAYYEALYDALDNPAFIAAVRESLRQRNLSSFNAGAPPTMNAAKQALIDACKSDAAEVADELVRAWPADVITAGELGRQLFGDDAEKYRAQLKHRAVEARMVKWRGPGNDGKGERRLRVAGLPAATGAWVLRNCERWASADADAVRAEIARGYRAERVQVVQLVQAPINAGG